MFLSCKIGNYLNHSFQNLLEKCKTLLHFTWPSRLLVFNPVIVIYGITYLLQAYPNKILVIYIYVL